MNIFLIKELKYRKFAFLAGLLILILAACTNAKEITIQDPWSRPALSENNAAAYFVVNNSLSEPDQLISASSSIAEFTEVHLSLMQNGKMMMQQQEFVEIPANSSVEFKPKDFHVMLINLNQDLNVGDDYELTLFFDKNGSITITVPVKEQE